MGCSDFTQIVWFQTTQIGCASAVCPGVANPYKYVCFYATAGNVGGLHPLGTVSLCSLNGGGTNCSSSTQPPDTGNGQAATTCVASGGTVATSSCCLTAGNFPNTCQVGACSCAPASSHAVQTCSCPTGTCFDGVRCVASSYPPTCPTDTVVHQKYSPPEVAVHFLFQGMLNGLCDDPEEPVPPAPCPCQEQTAGYAHLVL